MKLNLIMVEQLIAVTCIRSMIREPKIIRWVTV